MNNKKAMVVYAFAGLGKTTFSKQFKNTLDLEESNFRYLSENTEQTKGLDKPLNLDFPQNYYTALEEALNQYDYVFVGYNAIKYCQDNNIDYIIFLPKLKDKSHLLNRYINRDNSKNFIENLNINYEVYINKEKADKYAEKIIYLNENEYIYDGFEKLGLIKDNICLPYNNNTISVVIPIHNGNKTLERLFNSIKAQTYKDLQIILINDNSTDNTNELCKHFMTEFENVVYKEVYFKNVSLTRNSGLKFATGKYVCFVDSDDELEPNYAKNLLSALQKTNSDMCMSGLYEVVDNNKFEYGPKTQLVGDNHDSNLFVSLFNNCWFPVPWNKLFKTSIIKNNKLKFNKNINYDEDTIFNLQYYSLARKIVIIPDKLYNYHITSNSLTKKGEEKIFISSEKTIKYRLNTPKKLFGENKEAIFISAKKILKAVLQEGKILYKNGKQSDEILKLFTERLKNKYVVSATKYLCVLENNYNEYFIYNKIFKEKNTKFFYEYITR